MSEALLVLSLLSSSFLPLELELLLDREARPEVEFDSLTKADWFVDQNRNIIFQGEVGGVKASTGSHYVGFTRFTLKPFQASAPVEIQDSLAETTKSGSESENQGLSGSPISYQKLSKLVFSAQSSDPDLIFELILHTQWTKEQSMLLRRGVSLQAGFKAQKSLNEVVIDASQIKVVSWGSEVVADPSQYLTGPIERIGVQVSRGSKGEIGRKSAQLFAFDLKLDNQIFSYWVD